MDMYFDLSKYDSEDLHACMAACGQIDRLGFYSKDKVIADLNVMKENAGLIPAPVPGSRNAMIATGAFEWLKELHKNEIFSLSNTSVKALHRKLFKYSERDEGSRGNYRTDLDEDMKTLFEETKKYLRDPGRHPLLIISLFRISFIKLMPFITGNAQCANFIAYALLISNTYPRVSQLPLIASLNNPDSAFIQDSPVTLPAILLELLTTRSRALPTPEHTPQSSHSRTYLNSRRQSLLKCIEKNAPLKISDIMTFFPDQSRNTIKKDLLFLRENMMVDAKGEGRGVIYDIII
ncbi:MAG: hypothetical protein K9N05_00085 [Candidatus Marinimicrobia bacterium]|nr:hypothetical protein [Candidatus Neomarinimicrobiota bacterium]